MIYVVPSLKAKEKLQCEGKAWAESQGFTYVPRGKRTIQALMDEYGEDFLVYSSRGPQIDRPEGSHFFSLNMAELRIQNLRKGQRDHLLEALMGRGLPSCLSPSSTAPAALAPMRPLLLLACLLGHALMPWRCHPYWKRSHRGAFPILSTRKTTSRRHCDGFLCAVAIIAITYYPTKDPCTTSSISIPCSSGLSRRAASSSPSGPLWNTAV